jgi:AAA domain/Toprim domain
VSVEELLARLDGVRRSGSGWTAKCPSHEDHHPSLSVTQADDRLLPHCHKGCTTEEILLALGLGWHDLYDHPTSNTGEFVALYDYVDETGGLLFQVCRTPDKRFLQRRPDGNGGWIWKLGDTRRVLYRLPLVVAAVRDGHTVWIAEGEKDVLALEAAGVIATCNPGGVRKWRSEYTDTLAGATEIVVVADRDEEGRLHAEQVRTSLTGKVGRVRVVEAVEGKDAADHLAAGRGLGDFRPLEQEPAEATPVDPTVTFAEFVGRRDENSGEALIQTESEGPMLHRGGLAILSAKTGDGKTTWGVELILHACAGREFLGLRFSRPVRVLVIENEGPREAFREKLEARLESRGDGWDDGGDAEAPRIWDVPAEWGQIRISDPVIRERLRRAVDDHRIDLVVSDTLTRFGVRGNGTPEETREFVEWLTELGLGRDLAFLLLHHPRTRPDPGESELERVAGAWPPHADLILLLQRRDGDRARLSFPKTRWAHGNRPACILAFDPETATFTYVGVDEAEQRDYVTELAELMGDGDWWTVTQLRKPKDQGGIGAAPQAIKQALTDDCFESVSGDEIGRRSDSTYYRLKQASRAPGDGRDASPCRPEEEEASPSPSSKRGLDGDASSGRAVEELT